MLCFVLLSTGGLQVLFSISPHGHAAFVLDVFEGVILDKAITQMSGLVELMQTGSSVHVHPAPVLFAYTMCLRLVLSQYI